VATLYSIGHSTRALEEFVALLEKHEIRVLADIRAFPGSRRMPHFSRESLERALLEAGIEYIWVRELGGRRKKRLCESPNFALRNQSFRNYADHMLTAEFTEAAEALAARAAEEQRVAYMCAERLWWQCHRMLVSDWFVAHGHEVLHIVDEAAPKQHVLTSKARMREGRLVYSGDSLF
jgi:uncharacterized protein (DUF488 family)